nr:hypothetical protein [Nordella sp. HKS 07]
MLSQLFLFCGIESYMLAVARLLYVLTHRFSLPLDFLAATPAHSAYPGLDLVGAAHPDRTMCFSMIAQEGGELLPARTSTRWERCLIGELRQSDDKIDGILIINEAAASFELKLAALR